MNPRVQRVVLLVIVAGLSPWGAGGIASQERSNVGPRAATVGPRAATVGPRAATAGTTAVVGSGAGLLALAGEAADESPIRGWNVVGGRRHEFYFSRAYYGGSQSDFFRGFPSWSVDFPKADQQFLMGVQRLVDHLDVYEWENPVALTDPRLFDFPFLYAVEVGYMSLDPNEIAGLRRYLLSGGFLVVDDFWGSREWANFEYQMARVLPEFPIVDLPLEHPIFSAFYDVEGIVQVPNVGNGRMGGPTWEKDGFVPYVRGILDDEGRLLVVINFNSDLGDAWEWAEDPYYPLEFSTYAYQVGVNFVIYSMTH